ncbi:MAG: hypothetical protein HKN17_04615 [Rhodothermales bacterium]|nr:hypothetical protein [Rhodothermales bacterium]
MLFIVSDLHLGRRPDEDTAILGDLSACVERVVETSGSPAHLEVVFLGDVFDAYVDYAGYRPPNLERWTALVEDLRSRGISVSYHAGNHDRWHRGTICELIGITPLRDADVRETPAGRVLLTHGDRQDAHGRLTGLVRGISGAAWAHRAYALVLPARLGNSMAAAVSRRYAHTDASDRSVEALRDAAFDWLEGGRADVVVLGHCHRAELSEHAGGVYLNTGDWYVSRSFGLVDASGKTATVRLMRFTEGDLDVVQSASRTTKTPDLALSKSKARITP